MRARRGRPLGGTPVLVVGLAGIALWACSPHTDPFIAEPTSPLVETNLHLSPHSDKGRTDGGSVLYPSAGMPLSWSEQQRVVASDSATGTGFGGSVALSADTAIMGARSHKHGGTYSGTAYVFARDAANWTQQQELFGAANSSGSQFGERVALSGETVLVGAKQDDTRGFIAGAAYTFVRNAGTWVEQQMLLGGDTAPIHNLGASVALDGDTALVGAPGVNGGTANSGAAYVFVRNANSWTEQQKLSASDPIESRHLGLTAALSNDTAIVGAPWDGSGGAHSGAVYVFVRTAKSWAEQQKLVASDPGKDHYFGISLALHGDTAIANAPGYDHAGGSQGATYIFVRNASTWTEQQKLTPNNAAAADGFALSVALVDNRALIGNLQSAGDESVYFFERNASTWTEQQKLSASDATEEDRFGSSVALSDENVLVGARGDDDAGANSGAAYFFALRLDDGQPCTSDEACGSQFCVDGFCCDGACDEQCETCNVAGSEGSCTLTPSGGAGMPDCGGYLCDGISASCPDNCRSDGECSSDHYCRGALACLPRASNGQTCIRDGSCLSDHCVEGICCDDGCDAGCGSCTVAGLEGVCTPLSDGQPGALDCAPYQCSGSDTACPASCEVHRDCVLGFHCAGGKCQPDGSLGDTCTDDDGCASSHCTNELCCAAVSCGAYRCGPAGACQNACSSSAQCASGNQCSSSGKCEPLPIDTDAAGESGACALVGAAAPKPSSRRWLAGLGLLAFFAATRKRRPDKLAPR